MSGRSRKRLAGRGVWWGRVSPWIILGLCVLIALARPVYAQLKPEATQSWVQVYQVQAPAKEQAAAPGNDQAFGRQLDTLTEFYDKLINFLFVLLATITALAFFTIRANTKAEQERAAFEAIDSERVKGLIQGKVAEEISVQIGDIKATLEELQALYEVLDDAVIERARRGKESGDRQAENAGN